MSVLVLFCGAGGSTKGIADALPGAGLLGVDRDANACRTHAAAGYPTVQADLSALPTGPFKGHASGVWASPPCPDFSRAGKRRGLEGPTGNLIFTALEWVEQLQPQWAVFEQVPDVLPWWGRFARQLGQHGYSTWAGLLNAADYGVPQTRVRAFLLASRCGPVAPSVQTHARYPHPRLDGTEELPWVSMADALGWGLTDEMTAKAYNIQRKARGFGRRVRSIDLPSPTILASDDNGDLAWVYERPATTVMGTPRIYPADGHHPEMGRGHASARAVRVTLEELATLQGFPPDWPFRGSKSSVTTQIGNAVPPAMARVCTLAVTRAQEAVA